MSGSVSEQFRLSWPWTVLFVAGQLPLLAMAVVIAMSGAAAGGLVCAAMASLYAWLPIWATHISVGSDGLNVYRSLYKGSCSDVVAAKRLSILGLGYIRVQRNRGVSVWLPLYLISHRKLDDALRDWVPSGNPIERCL